MYKHNPGNIINPIAGRYKDHLEKISKNKDIVNKKNLQNDNIKKYTNGNLSPLDVVDSPWLYEKNMDVEYRSDGKWMLFYEHNIFNEKWKLAICLFREQKLKNVVSMKCSTNSINERASSIDNGVIILYCNNSDDKSYIIDIGKNILKLFNHKEKIYYKTDMQTMEGTKATGCAKNHKYYLEPKLSHNFIDDPD